VIPHTGSHRRWVSVRPGDPVNVEVDLLAKYVERLMERAGDERGGRAGRERLSRRSRGDRGDRRGRIVIVVDDADRENEGT
jgi:hypothetical protein